MPPKRKNDFLQESFVIPFDHPQVTTDTTWNFFKVPAGRKVIVDKVDYVNHTGLAEDATNIFAMSVKNGSTVIAGPLSTDSAAASDASFGAGVITEVPLSATVSDRVLAAGDSLSLLADEGGTATLPAGRVVVHARYVQ